MTTDIFRTLIVPVEDVDTATALAMSIDPQNYSGVFQTPLGPSSNGPITHYVSSGYVNIEWFTQFAPQCPTLISSEEEPFTVFGELSLVIVDPPQEHTDL
jgi:hypothetical protein